MLIRFLLILAIFCCISFPAIAQTLTVLAAVSLKEALDDQVAAFEKQSGQKVVISYAGSNVLARQIQSGAPADVFISADSEWMDYLEARKLLAPHTRTDLVSNQLVLIAPVDNPVQLSLKRGSQLEKTLLKVLGGQRLAIANPETVPAGKYGKAALQSLGVWTTVQPFLASTENVRAALLLVARGEAPLGIVYRTDALVEPRVRIVEPFAAGLHLPITYPAALLLSSQHPQAKALLNYLASPGAAALWRSRGFFPL